MLVFRTACITRADAVSMGLPNAAGSTLLPRCTHAKIMDRKNATCPAAPANIASAARMSTRLRCRRIRSGKPASRPDRSASSAAAGATAAA